MKMSYGTSYYFLVRQLIRRVLLKIERVQMTLPDGRETVYDLVAHPGAVTIRSVDAEGNVYFVKQYRLGRNRCFWNCRQAPAVPNETPEAWPAVKCAKRPAWRRESLRGGRFLYGTGGIPASTCTSTWRLSFRMRRWPGR